MDAMSWLAPAPALTFADAAMARALHLSTMSSSSSDSLSARYSAPLLADLPYYCSVVADDSVLHHQVAADSPPPPGRRGPHHHQNKQLAPAGGRAGKRRSRASKRAPTTYISTDPTNFRIMVQQITGVQADDEPAAHDDIMLKTTTMAYAAAASPSAAALHQQPCFPTLDSWNVMYETTTTDLL